MKKKVLAIVLAMVMSMTMLVGCDQIVYQAIKRGFEEEATEEYEAYTESEVTEEVTEEEVTEADVAEDIEEPEVTEEVVDEDTEEPETSVADSNIQAVEGTLDNPGLIGEWVATKTYSGETSDYHTVYFKITGVIRGEEAQKVVDDYNAGDHFVVMNELEYDDLEYCVVTYETYFPEDFPEGEYGLYSADIDLSVCNLEDSGSIGNYIGLSSVWDISEDPEDFHAGDTFTEGKAIFAMIKDFSDYLFVSSYYVDSNEYSSYVKGE